MPIDMNKLVKDNLITTFKRYPTIVQDTIVEIIGDELQKLYDYTENFCETVLDPNIYRLDIIKAKAAQYGFEIRDEASLSEQLALLNSVTTIHSRRGSIDTIENMKRYYGGDLPENVNIEIPAKTLFRYNLSKLSGKDKFQDGQYIRSGVYTLNVDGDYDLDKLKEFVNKELRVAGTVITYNKIGSSSVLGNNDYPMKSDNVYKDTRLYSTKYVMIGRNGFIWSALSPLSGYPTVYKSKYDAKLSGLPDILLNLTRVIEIGKVTIGNITADMTLVPTVSLNVIATTYNNPYSYTSISKYLKAICTPINESTDTIMHYYDVDGNDITDSTRYPGYFVLGETLLGEVIN